MSTAFNNSFIPSGKINFPPKTYLERSAAPVDSINFFEKKDSLAFIRYLRVWCSFHLWLLWPERLLVSAVTSLKVDSLI